jgi:hypothetical protein
MAMISAETDGVESLVTMPVKEYREYMKVRKKEANAKD